MRKTVLIVSIIIAIILTGITTVHAATASANLNASSTSVKPGDTFTVTLNVECDGGIALISGNEDNDGFKMNYDGNKLELVSKEAKGLIDLNEEATSGTICLMGSSTSFSSGEVYEITFKVKTDATDGDVEFSTTPIVITNFEDNESTITVQSISVEITGSSTPTELTNPAEPEEPTAQSNSGNKDGAKSSTPNTTSTSTSGKTPDTTTATSALPKAGSIVIRGLSLSGLIVVAVLMYKKIKQYRGI